MSVGALKILYYLLCAMCLLFFSSFSSTSYYLLYYHIKNCMFNIRTFILGMKCECGFIQLSWPSYINNEMELLVSLLEGYGVQLYSSYDGQCFSNIIRNTPKFSLLK